MLFVRPTIRHTVGVIGLMGINPYSAYVILKIILFVRPTIRHTVGYTGYRNTSFIHIQPRFSVSRNKRNLLNFHWPLETALECNFWKQTKMDTAEIETRKEIATPPKIIGQFLAYISDRQGAQDCIAVNGGAIIKRIYSSV